MNRSHVAVLSLALLGAGLAMGEAHAQAAPVLKDRVSMSNAPGLCQAALPVFDTLIRKRPKAVQNEGASDAFVTCSFTHDFATLDSTVTGVEMWFINQSAAPATVTCTAVFGYETGVGFPPNSTKTTLAIAANGTAQRSLGWSATEFGSATLGPGIPVSVSCQLPPGTGINDTYIAYKVDVTNPPPAP